MVFSELGMSAYTSIDFSWYAQSFQQKLNCACYSLLVNYYSYKWVGWINIQSLYRIFERKINLTKMTTGKYRCKSEIISKQLTKMLNIFYTSLEVYIVLWYSKHCIFFLFQNVRQKWPWTSWKFALLALDRVAWAWCFILTNSNSSDDKFHN